MQKHPSLGLIQCVPDGWWSKDIDAMVGSIAQASKKFVDLVLVVDFIAFVAVV